MKPRSYAKNENIVTMEKLFPSGLYSVQVRIGPEVYDKVRCDDYGDACEYFRAFKRIADAN